MVKALTSKIESLEASIRIMAEREAAELQSREEALRGMSNEKMDSMEKYRVLMTSMENELSSMRRQEEELRKQAIQLQAKSKEQQDRIVELDVIRKEMDSINTSADELKEALDKLTVGAGYG